jgi:hypothetical protein
MSKWFFLLLKFRICYLALSLFLASILFICLQQSQQYAVLSLTPVYDQGSPFPQDTYALKTQIYIGFLQISLLAQRFVMGPRLILDVQEFHAKLVASSDAETGITSIAFQERVHVSTGSCV